MEFLNDVGQTFWRFADNIAGRLVGPMKLRLVLQPLIAGVFAIRAGIQDGRAGRPPYFWTMFTVRQRRRALLREGWRDVGKVFIMAVVIDVIYQIAVARWVYPNEALLVAAILAFVPYMFLRGLVTRLTPRTRVPPADEARHRGAA